MILNGTLALFVVCKIKQNLINLKLQKLQVFQLLSSKYETNKKYKKLFSLVKRFTFYLKNLCYHVNSIEKNF